MASDRPKPAPRFFATADAFRRWLEKNHDTADELWVGYHKKDSGKRSITWSESVDEALCFGWIDGIRKSIDESSYTNRFTPRRRGSTWSKVNIRRVEALIEAGRMRPAGLAAYEARTEFKSGTYSYEQRPLEMPEPYAGLMKKNQAAWSFFQSQPPGYRKMMSWFVVSAKRDETRLTRLEKLIDYCARGERIPVMGTEKTKHAES
jgi:uncharacterized protein YdeI (YjbR/CyaY-like superfamily)